MILFFARNLLCTKPGSIRLAGWAHLQFQGLKVVGAGGEVCVHKRSAAEGPVVGGCRAVVQLHAVSLAVATV